MANEQKQNNVIQFPGSKKKDVEANRKPKTAVSETAVSEATSSPTSTPTPTPTPTPTSPPTPKASATTPKSGPGKKARTQAAGALIAIALFSIAANRYAFQSHSSVTVTEASSNLSSRSIASVERVSWQRDADWEKKMAESLASPQVRTLASLGIGHSASIEEQLRWGALEEKYTIVFKPDVHVLDSIFLQDSTSKPAYILDRSRFLKDYGTLFENDFGFAQLTSVEVGHDKTIEAYTIFDKENRPKSTARFELDIYKRLLSLKVEPAHS